VDKAPTIVLVFTLLGLLLMIAFSSGTEVAMLSVNRYRVRTLANSGNRRAKLLEKLLSEPDRWLGANLVILALASVAASTIATLLALRSDLPHALPVELVLLTVTVIVFCELATKMFAAMHAEGVALHCAFVYRLLLWITWPVTWLAN
jgi:Mg2+/Co2+ transporter CorB